MPFIKDYVRYAWHLLNGFRVAHEQEFARMRAEDIAAYLQGDQPLRVLDLANGRLRPQYTILKAAGHHVVGIDLVNRPHRTWVDRAYQIARRLYTWRLGLLSTASGPETLIYGDVGNLPFPDNWFDLITSVAAFEHFLDVPAVVADLHRVLRPGGVAWVCLHLFTSPSGGHNLSFTEYPLRTIPAGVEPWDHLRSRCLPFTVPLNEWRKGQYLELFGRYFSVEKHYCATREGEEFLTPDIARELADYSRDELTCSSLVVVARKAS
jgi:SAM-dependent methyltransferase